MDKQLQEIEEAPRWHSRPGCWEGMCNLESILEDVLTERQRDLFEFAFRQAYDRNRDTIKRLTEENERLGKTINDQAVRYFEMINTVKKSNSQRWNAEDEAVRLASLLKQKDEENKPLLEFAKKVLQYGFDGDLCGGDIQDLGVKYGLLVEDKYDPDKHREDVGEDFETGDTIYMFSEILKPQDAGTTE